MKIRAWMWIAVGCIALSGVGMAQEKGQWRAESKTARSMTGDVAFSATKMSINFSGYTIAQIRTLTPTEIAVVFDGADASTGSGNLYRTDIPGTKKFMGKNTLCGSEDVEYVVTFVSGREMQLALFLGVSGSVTDG